MVQKGRRVNGVRAVGRLEDTAGNPLGTGFAVTDGWALTAFHCVGDRHADPPVLQHPEAKLVMGRHVLGVTVSEYDVWLDVALLKLSSPLPPDLHLIALGSEVLVGSRFEAFGYPAAAEDAELEGWAVSGWVSSVLMRLRNGAPLIAVNVNGLDHELPLQGISGSPVLVGRETQLAVAMMRYSVLADEQTGVALGNTLFATPIEAVAERFPVCKPRLVVSEREQHRRATLGSLLRTELGSDGLPPALATASPYTLGIPRAAPIVAGAADRYIERAADGEIRKALSQGRFVIVKGAAKAGKSRTAYEAVRALYPEASIIAPRQRCRALVRILEEDLLPSDPGRLVFWLDEFAGFLAPTEGVDRPVIDQLLKRYPQALLVGTIVGEDLSRLRSSDDLTRTTREVLDAATEIYLPTIPTEAERARARELYPGEDFRATIGVAERLIAAPELVKRFDDAADPIGWCLVMAAVDWWRMGPTGPIPEHLLRALASHYRDIFFPPLELDEDEIRKGLDWARKPVGSSEALLNVVDRIPERTYRPFDLLRSHVQKRSDTATVPRPCWDTAVNMATPTELIAIALGAVTPTLLRLTDAGTARTTAKRALLKVLDSDDTDSLDWAALLLGDLEMQDGNVDTARELLTRAVNVGNRKIADLAKVDLGGLLVNSGEMDQARALLEAAIASGNTQVMPLALANLGGSLLITGEIPRARELLEAAIASRNPIARPLAQTSLASLLIRTGETGRARTLLEAAITSRNPQVIPIAQANLGALLMNAGELDQARALLEAAAASGGNRVGPMARVLLAGLLAKRGDWAGAQAAYQQCINAGDPYWSQGARIKPRDCGCNAVTWPRPGNCWRQRSHPATRRYCRWLRRT